MPAAVLHSNRDHLSGNTDDVVYLRFEADGPSDASFGDGGQTIIDATPTTTGGSDIAHDLVLMPDGTLLAVGETDNGTDTDLVLARVHGDTGHTPTTGSDSGGRLYAVHDANFNLTSIVEHDGSDITVVERYLFDAYGERTVLNADWTVDTDGLSDFIFVHGHQGGRHDVAVGLVNFRYRDLDMSLGRWARQDPLGYVDGPNRYQATLGNPIAYLDAMGLEARSAFKDLIDCLFKARHQFKQDILEAERRTYLAYEQELEGVYRLHEFQSKEAIAELGVTVATIPLIHMAAYRLSRVFYIAQIQRLRALNLAFSIAERSFLINRLMKHMKTTETTISITANTIVAFYLSRKGGAFQSLAADLIDDVTDSILGTSLGYAKDIAEALRRRIALFDDLRIDSVFMARLRSNWRGEVDNAYDRYKESYIDCFDKFFKTDQRCD